MSDDIRPSIGRHAAVCRSIQFGHTEKNDPQVAIGFEIFGEEDPDAGTFITYFGMFTEAKEGNRSGAYDITMKALRTLGWQGDELAELPDLAAAGELAKEVWLVIEHEEYKEQIRAKVKWVNPAGGGAVQMKKPMDTRELASFSALMKQRLRASSAGATRPNGGAGVSRPAQPTHPNAPGSMDDIPF